jgi:hypothetical protein
MHEVPQALPLQNSSEAQLGKVTWHFPFEQLATGQLLPPPSHGEQAMSGTGQSMSELHSSLQAVRIGVHLPPMHGTCSQATLPSAHFSHVAPLCEQSLLSLHSVPGAAPAPLPPVVGLAPVELAPIDSPAFEGAAPFVDEAPLPLAPMPVSVPPLPSSWPFPIEDTPPHAVSATTFTPTSSTQLDTLLGIIGNQPFDG